ncbi:hypothetical protein [Pseudonocardia hierapolitana]|uniref:hypothetical protein n=1 Tax=Pseudonocardia hierapolitana TaxID=1128676 RepID=UPI001478637C|nr:hypothetical protein [Pseudonocardia hierapolitana]
MILADLQQGRNVAHRRALGRHQDHDRRIRTGFLPVRDARQPAAASSIHNGRTNTLGLRAIPTSGTRRASSLSEEARRSIIWPTLRAVPLTMQLMRPRAQVWECALDDLDELSSTLRVELEALARLPLTCPIIAAERAQMKQPYAVVVDDGILAVHLSRVRLQALVGRA